MAQTPLPDINKDDYETADEYLRAIEKRLRFVQRQFKAGKLWGIRFELSCVALLEREKLYLYFSSTSIPEDNFQFRHRWHFCCKEAFSYNCPCWFLVNYWSSSAFNVENACKTMSASTVHSRNNHHDLVETRACTAGVCL